MSVMYKSPSLWYPVIAAVTGKDSTSGVLLVHSHPPPTQEAVDLFQGFGLTLKLVPSPLPMP